MVGLPMAPESMWSPAALARSSCVHPRKPRAARTCAPLAIIVLFPVTTSMALFLKEATHPVTGTAVSVARSICCLALAIFAACYRWLSWLFLCITFATRLPSLPRPVVCALRAFAPAPCPYVGPTTFENLRAIYHTCYKKHSSPAADLAERRRKLLGYFCRVMLRENLSGSDPLRKDQPASETQRFTGLQRPAPPSCPECRAWRLA